MGGEEGGAAGERQAGSRRAAEQHAPAPPAGAAAGLEQAAARAGWRRGGGACGCALCAAQAPHAAPQPPPPPPPPPGACLQVERDVQRVPHGDEGQRDHSGGRLGAHNLGHRAAGRYGRDGAREGWRVEGRRSSGGRWPVSPAVNRSTVVLQRRRLAPRAAGWSLRWLHTRQAQPHTTASPTCTAASRCAAAAAQQPAPPLLPRAAHRDSAGAAIVICGLCHAPKKRAHLSRGSSCASSAEAATTTLAARALRVAARCWDCCSCTPSAGRRACERRGGARAATDEGFRLAARSPAALRHGRWRDRDDRAHLGEAQRRASRQRPQAALGGLHPQRDAHSAARQGGAVHGSSPDAPQAGGSRLKGLRGRRPGWRRQMRPPAAKPGPLRPPSIVGDRHTNAPDRDSAAVGSQRPPKSRNAPPAFRPSVDRRPRCSSRESCTTATLAGLG